MAQGQTYLGNDTSGKPVYGSPVDPPRTSLTSQLTQYGRQTAQMFNPTTIGGALTDAALIAGAARGMVPGRPGAIPTRPMTVGRPAMQGTPTYAPGTPFAMRVSNSPAAQAFMQNAKLDPARQIQAYMNALAGKHDVSPMQFANDPAAAALMKRMGFTYGSPSTEQLQYLLQLYGPGGKATPAQIDALAGTGEGTSGLFRRNYTEPPMGTGGNSLIMKDYLTQLLRQSNN